MVPTLFYLVASHAATDIVFLASFFSDFNLLFSKTVKMRGIFVFLQRGCLALKHFLPVGVKISVSMRR